MPSRHTPATFVQRHGLWTDQQARRAKAVAQAIKANKLEFMLLDRLRDRLGGARLRVGPKTVALDETRSD